MDHENAKASFTCYYDQLLEVDKRRALEEHLAGCAACRAEWESYKKTVEGLAGMHIAAPSERFAGNVTQEIKRRGIKRFWSHQNFLILKTALLSFILIALLVLMYLAYLFLFDKPESSAKPGAASKDRDGVHIIGPIKSEISPPPDKKK